ncbi:MAG: single-stranded DNA-binding protein [bacterium]
MNGMNRCVLMGHLNDAPTSEVTATGKKVAVFYIATNEFVKNADGEKIKRTDWHRVTTCGKVADACEKMLRKGSMVLVEGKIRNMRDKKGYEITGTEVSFISNYNTKEVKNG